LGQAGARQTDPNIRRVIDRETQNLAEADDGFVNKVMEFTTLLPESQTNNVLVDASEENRRIRENRALGLPVTTGETPELDPPKRTNAIQRAFDRFMVK
jgi:hypothetical protein